MGGEGHDRFDASSSRLVYEERVHDRTDARLKESVSQGHRIGHADADLLYQPRRSRSQPQAASGTEESQNTALAACRKGQEVKKPS
jgi:hypothetical protein